MSQETKWERVSLRMDALIRTRGPGAAFKALEKLLHSEPAASTEEEFESLFRATTLASQYGEVNLARKWTEAHRALREAKGPLTEPEVESYRLIRVAFEVGEKNYALADTILEQVNWGPLDVMVVDMPPGTGDAQLSLVQSIDLDGVVMVSTPQDVATGDVRRGIKMFERVNTRILGIVENMVGLSCPHCGEEIDVFGTGGGDQLAAETNLPVLGRVPLDPAVRMAGDAGAPTVLSAPDSAAGVALLAIADVVVEALTTSG